MKRILFIILIACFQNLFSAGFESEIFTPYVNMSFSETAFMPSVGDFFTGGDIGVETGLLAKINKRNSLFGLYTFDYDGPGFQPQEEGEFLERRMSHNINVEYRRNLGGKFRLRPSFCWSTEYRRSGANESWENGLYNTKSLGFAFAVDYFVNVSENKALSLEYLMRNIKFPNYTDLLLEFQNAGISAELSGGLYDQAYHQLNLDLSYGKFFGGISYVFQKYRNQRIIEDDGSGGGVYGNTLQKDKTISLWFGMKKVFWILDMAPFLTYSIHRSNQNFVRYKYLGDTNPDFIPGNYDYNEIVLSAPVDLLITGKWALSGALNLTRRDYTDRPARNAQNVYKSEKQNNTMTSLNFGIRKKMNEIAYMRLNYSIVVARSNNEFEKYLPYNYTGNTLSLIYEIKY